MPSAASPRIALGVPERVSASGGSTGRVPERETLETELSRGIGMAASLRSVRPSLLMASLTRARWASSLSSSQARTCLPTARVDAIPPLARAVASRAAANSSAVWKRSSGSRARALPRSSSKGASSGQSSLGIGIGSWRILVSVAALFSPRKSRRPVSDSQSMMPMLKRSLRWSAWPVEACSGDM